MLVISRNLVLAEGTADDPRLPLIGWRNVTAAANVAAESAVAGYPASNLANPDTSLLWRAAEAASQRIVIEIEDQDPLDYVGIAGHNFGSAGVAVAIEGKFDLEDEAWTGLVQETILPHDKPALFRFERQSYAAISLRLAAGTAAPEAAVLYAGRLTALDPGIELGFTPLPFGRESEVAAGRTVAGHYLGEIELSRFLSSEITVANMRPDWYRTELDPLFEASPRRAFFHAWDPVNHPHEVGFAWIVNNPQPVVDRANRRMSIALEMGGIAR